MSSKGITSVGRVFDFALQVHMAIMVIDLQRHEERTAGVHMRQEIHP